MSAAYGSLGNTLDGSNSHSSPSQSVNSTPKTASLSKKSSNMPSTSSSPNPSNSSPSSSANGAAGLDGLGTLGVAASQAASLGMNQASKNRKAIAIPETINKNNTFRSQDFIYLVTLEFKF